MADPAEVAPNVYGVLFENDRVRLLEVRLRPGDGSARHSHPDYRARSTKSRGLRRNAKSPSSCARIVMTEHC